MALHSIEDADIIALRTLNYKEALKAIAERREHEYLKAQGVTLPAKYDLCSVAFMVARVALGYPLEDGQ